MTSLSANSPSPDQPLHVLHVVDDDVAARFGRMLRQVGLALEEAGLRQTLLTDSVSLAAALDATPVEVLGPRALYGLRSWGLSKSLTDHFETPPDVVHFWGASGLRGVGNWATDEELPGLIHMTARDEVDELCQRGLRPNEFVATACRAYWPPLAQRFPRIGATPNILVPALLSPESEPVEIAAQPAQTLGILWSGIIDEDSGLPVLVDAIAALRGRGCEVHAALIGWGPATHKVWRHIRARGVGDCVTLVEDLWLWDQALAGADIYVIPARQVELSLAPLLAMSLGKLVIAVRDQVADWMIEGQTVACFAPNLADELAVIARRLSECDPPLVELRKSASRYVREHHSVTRLADRLVGAYRAILRAHAAS